MNALLDAFCREHAEMCDLLDRLLMDSVRSGSLALVPNTCHKILLHCSVEAGVLVPAVAELDGNDELLRETGATFAVVTALISELSALHRADEHFMGILAKLRRCVFSHVESAEAASGLMERARELNLNWQSLEKRAAERRKEMTARRPSRSSWAMS